ncbi:MAG: dihydrofolate reductase family protein [Solirubrobacterales bacterium]
MLRLFPQHSTIDVGEVYDGLDLATLAPATRPYVIVNMVATADGQARVGGDTAELGNATDMKLFAKLREQVDCVIAGTQTIGIENYNAPARTEAVRARRAAAELAPRPYFATITRSGVLPIAAPLFQDEGIEVIVFSDAELAIGDAKATIHQVRETDPAAMLERLRSEFGIRSVLLEGGPRINTAFFAAGLIDELFLTLVPVLTGAGTPFPIIAGALPARLPLKLLSTLFDEDHLFLRYQVD